MSELAMSVHDQGRFTVVEATGDIDLISAPSVRNKLESLFRDGRMHLIIDLSAVPFLDSTGIGVLVGAQRAVKRHGGDVRIVCSEPRVLRVFTITGLDQVFTIHETADQAVSEDETSA